MSYERKSILACQPATTRGQAVHLSADPKGKKMCYTNGRTVIIRDLANPEVSSEYTEHSSVTTTASWSPSGYYIASGDVSGNVRIWDTINEEHILKIEAHPLSGRVCDVAWDFESQRIIAVGEGREKFGHAFAADTANSCGDIIGHSKTANTCDIRGKRPYRAATAGDDMIVNFYHGPPYKFVKAIRDHTRFVQCVRFSPDGAFLATTGSDGKIFLYDGKTGDKVGEILDAHSGGIYSLSWSPDSKHFMTSSADRSVKFWNAETRKVVNTVQFGKSVGEQQVGNLWAGEHIISLGLSGDLHYLDLNSPNVLKTISGHQKGITAFSTNANDSSFYTGSYDGLVYSWNYTNGLATPIAGKGHTNQVSTLALAGNTVFSAGLDDTFKSMDISKASFNDVSVSTESAPKGVATKGDVSVIATLRAVQVVSEGKKTSSLPANYSPSAIALSIDGTEVAVGGEDTKVHFYALHGLDLDSKDDVVLESNRGTITALAYSPDGKYLAVADTDRKVLVYDTATKELKFSEWVFHSSRVNCVAWSPDSLHAASGGLDRDIYVWSTEKPMKSVAIKGAHQDGVSGVGFLDNTTVISAGHDACVKTWTIKHH